MLSNGVFFGAMPVVTPLGGPGGGRGLAVERGGGGSALVGGEGIGSHAATVGSMADKAPKFDATPSSVCFFKTCSFHFQ